MTRRLPQVRWERKETSQWMHCPECMRWRWHTRRAQGMTETYTCEVCGNVQSYLRRERKGVKVEMEA